MLKRFLSDKRGNFAAITALTTLPLLAAVALAVDFSEMTRQKQAMLHALDATCFATAREFLSGASEADSKAYAQKFFTGNLGPAARYTTALTTIVPTVAAPRDNIECMSTIAYVPYFRGAVVKLLTGNYNTSQVDFSATSRVKIQNTVEVALVLDNSGSMGPPYSNRIDILKPAAKALVDTLAARAKLMKQVAKPVQFSLVPFAASVNVGSNNDEAAWMDLDGVSPVQYENFDLPVTIAANKEIKWKDGAWRKVGNGWPVAERETIFNRFSLYKDMRRYKASSGTATDPATSWQGCMEARPYPYNVDDTPPTKTEPGTMYVPMFAPDEHNTARKSDGGSTYNSNLNWWRDIVGRVDANDNGQFYDSSDYTSYYQVKAAQRDLKKYYTPAPYGTSSDYSGRDKGPNSNCTSNPIMALTDVSTTEGADAVKAQITAMQPLGGTDVPEGMAWGWRTLSSYAPFTGGRPEVENGNDKVLIVLTDGANTYYKPSGSDLVDNESDYSAYGYTGQEYDDEGVTRLYMGTPTTFDKNLHTETNFSAALNIQLQSLCDKAKAAELIVMTVALDLSESDTEEKKQIDGLRKCSSDSRFKKNADGTPKKLFWNSKSSTLSDDFKAIGDELSNLRLIL